MVDDSKVAHLTLRKLLLERGIEVDWVGSGEDCIKYLETKKPDIIFMDVMMPGMDGFETTRAITGQHQDASPSSCAPPTPPTRTSGTPRKAARSGFSKPYTPDQLDAVMQTVSEGTAAISMEEIGAPATAVPMPSVVEKTPAALPEWPPPKSGSPRRRGSDPRPRWNGRGFLGSRTNRRTRGLGSRGEGGRDIQELVPNLTREIAVQTARGVAEDLGRRAAHAAVRASQEAAKQVATEIARGHRRTHGAHHRAGKCSSGRTGRP